VQPGARRVCRPYAAGRPSVPPWSRRPLAPAPKWQRRRIERFQPGHILVPGQPSEYCEHRRQVRLADMQRMCHSAENPLLVGGQAHQPAPAWCPAARGWWTSHGIGITIACSFRRRGEPSAVTLVSWLSAALACPPAGAARRPPPQRCFPYLCWRPPRPGTYAQPAHGLGAWPGSIADRPAPVTRFDRQVCWHR